MPKSAHITGTAVARRVALCFLGLAALVAGCVSADPMPSPGSPDRQKILVSATNALRQGGPVEIVGLIGLRGAAPGIGVVEIRQPFSDTITIARTAPDGTFAAVIGAAAGDRLSLTFREDPEGPASDPVDIEIVRYVEGVAPAAPETETDAASGDRALTITAPTASAPDGRGRSTISGRNLTPGDVAALGNARTGEVVEATVDPAGSLSASIGAATGDTIVVIVRSPQGGLTSQAASLSVPAP